MNSDLRSYPDINTEKSNIEDINKHDTPHAKLEHPGVRGGTEARQDYSIKTQENDRNQVYPVIPYPSAQTYPVVNREAPLIQDDPRPEHFDKEHGEDTKPENSTSGNRHPHMVCSDCGHVVLGPERCAECGRVIPPPPDLCPLCGQTLPDDWLYDNIDTYDKNSPRFTETSVCRASTSRKLYKLGGECESARESDSGSSDSEDYGNVCEKPVTIADSATLLHKNRWQAFRNYFRWFRGPHKFLKLHRSDNNDDEDGNYN